MVAYEKLIFYARNVAINGKSKQVSQIGILNQRGIAEQTYQIKGKLDLLDVKNDKVIASGDNYELEWNLSDLNHSPKVKYEGKPFLTHFRPTHIETFSGKDVYLRQKVRVPKPAMKITPLGIGDANPRNPLGNSCFLLEADGRYLIDFPRVLPNDRRLNRLKGIFITHVHNDHIGSLVDYLLTQGPKKKPEERAFIYVGQLIDHTLTDLLQTLGLKTHWNNLPVSIYDFANRGILTPGLDWNMQGSIKIESMYNAHGETPATALKISYKGKKIGISGDCNEDLLQSGLPTGNLMQDDLNLPLTYEKHYTIEDILESAGGDNKKRFDDCDLVFHEATLLPNPVHTHVEYLEKEFVHIKNKMFLYHVSRDFVSRVLPVACKGRTYRV
jgi:hypothetical protein